MLNKKVISWIGIFLWICIALPSSYASPDDELGQTIQIQTRFRHLIGRGTFTIVIRDLDHNQTIPYMFDVIQPNNLWLIFTHSRHYLITASRLQMDKYTPCCNQFKNNRTTNFCHLESNGRIMRGRSMRVIITGDLSPHPYTYSCQVTTFPDRDFTIVSKSDCPCPTGTTAAQKC